MKYCAWKECSGLHDLGENKMDFKKRAEEVRDEIIWSYGTGVSDESNGPMIEKALKEAWNAGIEKSAKLSEGLNSHGEFIANEIRELKEPTK